MHHLRHFLGTSLLALLGCQDHGIKAVNSTPEATITSHARGDAVDSGVAVPLRGRVSDPNHPADELLATWYLGEDEACAPTPPASDGSTRCDIVFDEEADVILEVSDPLNATGRASVSLEIVATEAPQVTILEPGPEGIYYSDQLIPFQASLSDGEDDPEALVATWESSLSGALELDTAPDTSGEILDHGYLEEGEHAIEIHALDSTGKSGSDSVIIHVGPPNSAPSCALLSPEDGSSGEEGDLVRFEGEVADVDVPSDWLSVTWRSDKDGDLGTSTPDSSGAVTFPFSGLSVDSHLISMIVTDEIGASCTASVVYTVGTPPWIIIDSPSPEAILNEGETITFAARVGDEQDRSNELSLSWVSDLDGELSTAAADSAGNTSFSRSDLSVGEHTVQVTVTDTDGLYVVENVAFTVNGMPSQPVVSISPDPATTEDDLVAVIGTDSVDPEGSSVSYRYAWYRNGVLSSYTSATVAAADTARDETWRVVVTPSDGMADGEAGEAEITIANTPPEVTAVSLSPSTPYTNDTLTVSVSTRDADADTLSLSYTWIVDGSTIAATGSSLDGATWFDKGQSVQVTVTPSDGTSAGSSMTSAAVTVNNTPPGAPMVSVDPASPDDADDLVCVVDTGSVDDDDDAVTYRVSWTVDGTTWTGSTTTASWAGDTIAGADTARGEVWECTVTPDDAEDDGAVASASATIGGVYTGWSSSEVDVSDADHILYGETAGDLLGPSSYVGPNRTNLADLDGDGAAELLVASAYNDGAATDAGATYIIFSSSLAASPTPSRVDLVADWTLEGERSQDHSGRPSAWIGDIDGDGLEDLGIAAHDADANGTNAGALYVVLGNQLGISGGTLSLADADWRIHGETAGDGFGHHYYAGDMNGDGLDDLLASSRYNDAGGTDAGKGYLMYSSQLGSTWAVNVASSSVHFRGEDAGDSAGRYIRGGGDIDADGAGDVVISAWYSADTGTRAGKGYVILNSSISSGTIDLSSADYKINGEASTNYLSHQISIDGDVDNDGQDDLLLSAYFNSGSGTYAGKGYLFLGSSLTGGSTGTRSPTSADFMWTGENAQDQLGSGIGYLGDVDADGQADIFLGAKYNDRGASNGGTAYLLLGSELGSGGTTGIGSAFEHAFVAVEANAECGAWSPGRVGDLDGDGLDDIRVDCPYSDINGTSSGTVYLFLTP